MDFGVSKMKQYLPTTTVRENTIRLSRATGAYMYGTIFNLKCSSEYKKIKKKKL